MKTYLERLNHVIPGGAHTYSRGNDQHPKNAPQILLKGKGAYVWDPEGRKYLDYGMALRAVTLGYSDTRVNAAAIEQVENGVNLTRPSMIELEAAEAMVELIPGAEMVKFAKNGSTVTTAAVKLARAANGKKYVAIPRQHPFFSFDDWFIGATALQRGIPAEHYSTTLLFDYGDVRSLEALFEKYPGEISCVMLEPATTVGPCAPGCQTVLDFDKPCEKCAKNQNNFLLQVQMICRKNSAVFILDEMITGFRWHLQGAQTYFGVEPDLSTFGKGMANGFSVAALVGKREIMDLGGISREGMERTFLISTTHGAEMPGMGALVKTIKIYKEQNTVKHMWNYGKKLFEGLNNVSRSVGLTDYFMMDGSSICMNFVTKDKDRKVSLPFRTLFMQEMVKSNVLMPWIAVSGSHTETELRMTLDAAEKALQVYKRALDDGIDKYLEGPAIKPVFRKFN